MSRFRVPLALIVILLAIVGAFLHPLALLLNTLPFDPHGLVGALSALRSVIADVLGWGVVVLVVVMLAYVVAGRVFGRDRRSLGDWLAEPEGTASAGPASHRVAVVVTAYNDAKATADTVRDFLRQPAVAKVVVIDNNSTDDTAALSRAAGATVIREFRQGYGHTCMRGLAEGLGVPDADVVVLTEGDGTFMADDLPKFLDYIDHADIVVGNRVVKGLVARDSQMDHFFTWGNIAVAMLLRLRFWDGHFLGPAGLTDVGCTYRAIRKDALERILPDLDVGGNHFSPHMLLVALSNGLSVVEIPIRFRRRVGQSKGASQSLWKGFQVGLLMIWHIAAYAPKRVRPKPAVVIERDGLIIRPSAGNTSGSPQVELVAGASESLAALSRGGHKVLVMADQKLNQQMGISRKLSNAIDARIASEVEHRGGRIDAFLVCPHGPGNACSCREPEPKLLIDASRRRPIDLARSVVVSDRPAFLQAAAGVGCETILIANSISGSRDMNGKSASDLMGAAELVLGKRPPESPAAPVELQTVS